MGFVATKWTDGDWIPRKDLLAWHAADTATDGQTVDDASGNNRDLDSGFGSTPPTLTPNYINGVAAIEFDGSTHDPLKWSGAMSAVKHAFIFAGYEDASFPAGDAGNAGLLTGPTSGDILLGNQSSTKFFDLDLELSGDYEFRRYDVAYAENNMQASFSGTIALFEISFAPGISLDGIQVGRQKAFAARLWKGPWCEHLLYSAVKNDDDRRRIYEYAAMKYLIWRKNAAGLDVWPFQPDWPRNLLNDKRILASTAVSGASKFRTKSTRKKGFEATFTDREPEEIDAATEFWDLKYPGTSFIYRDEAFTPSRDSEVKFASPIETPARGNRQMDYAIQVVEV